MREQSNCSGVEPGVINIPQLIRGSWTHFFWCLSGVASHWPLKPDGCNV
jgi:hypothetical protein